MLGEKIKTLRKAKGLSQEELAIRLHVVRQTISKWEKNLSVPDATILQELADILEVSVPELLGADREEVQDRNEIAEQLSRINEHLAVKNRRAKRIWTIVAIVVIVPVILTIALAALGVMNYSAVSGTTLSTAISMSTENPTYSEDEVQNAMKIVINEFKHDFKGCTLQTLDYDEETSNTENAEWAAQYQADEAIVLVSSFVTGSKGGDGSLNPNSTYKNWKWVLTRSDNDPWELQTWGY